MRLGGSALAREDSRSIRSLQLAVFRWIWKFRFALSLANRREDPSACGLKGFATRETSALKSAQGRGGGKNDYGPALYEREVWIQIRHRQDET